MEEFKKIDGYDNYEISNLGNVRNTDTGRILKTCKNSDGYYHLNLNKNGITKTLKIHRLIALHFIPNPENLREIDHIDQDKGNNSISNLRWISRSGNCRNRPKFKNSSSKYKGVCFDKEKRKYKATINFDNKQKHIGYYENEDDAARAFDTFVKQQNLTEIYDLNFPDINDINQILGKIRTPDSYLE